jgi:hypothetical protein
VYRSLPGFGRLLRQLLIAELVAGGFAYAVWRWAERNEATWLRHGSDRRYLQLLLVVCAWVLAAALVRTLVYRGSSWQPSSLASLVAVVLSAGTPILGALFLRYLVLSQVEDTPPPPVGFSVRHATSVSRIGPTKRGSEL